MFHLFNPNNSHKKLLKDDFFLSRHKKNLDFYNVEKKHKKQKSFFKVNIYYNDFFEDYSNNDNFKNEVKDKDSLNSTDQSSKSGNINEYTEKGFIRNESHSCNNLIHIGKVERQIEEQKRNISDDESEKINIELNKGNKKYLEKMQKDNIDFSNNMKNIFNNIGNKSSHKIEKEPEDINEDFDFFLKDYTKSENIRKLYYSKLLQKRVWIPLNDSKRHNNIIIFDWDDTLLPTSYLLSKNVIYKEKKENKLSEKDQTKIKKLEQLVKNLLEISLSKADVYIITNAGEGWVEQSAKDFYPNIKEILDEIEIISARKDYEKKYPENLKYWKIGAFLNLKSRLNEELITNIVCLGDSIFEMEAGKILASNFIHAVIKTIKFMESPRLEELNKQLNLVLNQFNTIFSSSKNLTVRVEKKRK